MDGGAGTPVKLSECEVCSHLGDVEYASSKYGSEDGDTSLPTEASRLVAAEEDPGGSRRRFVKRCPVCGTFYLYETDYEYLVNGSEDSEQLTRLTPDEACRYMTPEAHGALIARMRGDLESAQAIDRRYAGMSLAGYTFENRDMAGLESVVTHPDGEVVRGALLGLTRWSSKEGVLDVLAGMERALEQVAAAGKEGTSGIAQRLLRDVRSRRERVGRQSDGPL
jgi:hypothetical protein